MAKKLFEIKNENPITLSYVCLSDDWFSLQPWKHGEKSIKFFDYVMEPRKEVLMEYYYIGPFAIIKGKRYE